MVALVRYQDADGSPDFEALSVLPGGPFANVRLILNLPFLGGGVSLFLRPLVSWGKVPSFLVKAPSTRSVITSLVYQHQGSVVQVFKVTSFSSRFLNITW